MTFRIDQFARTRPYLYHLTHRDNLGGLRTSRTLHSAASIMTQAGDRTFLRQKRIETIALRFGTRTIRIRDQQPLYAGNIALANKWSFEDVIQLLNEQVFFWPGKEVGPIEYGTRHFQRYVDERPVVLRILTNELLNANDGVTPLFCKYNSGSPRCANGERIPRGPSTFVTSDEAEFTPSNVVEFVLPDAAKLPRTTEVAESVDGPWQEL